MRPLQLVVPAPRLLLLPFTLLGLLLLPACDAEHGQDLHVDWGVAPVPPLAPVEGAVFPPPAIACDELVSPVRNPDNGSEVGLIEVTDGRMFYSYHRYVGSNPNAPLFVIFNGGPSSATSPRLAVVGTGPMTVLWRGQLLDEPAENPASWTDLGYLLYLDAPSAGYSYQWADDSTRTPWVDAVDFLLASLRFVNCRADRPDIPIVVVGESYGGIRATLMHWLIRHPDGTSSGPTPHRDRQWSEAEQQAFAAEVRAHFDRIERGRGEADDGLQADEVKRAARQFFGQLLIQPGMLSFMQYPPHFTEAYQDRFGGELPASASAYSVNRSWEELENWKLHGIAMATTADTARALYGAPVEQIVAMAPELRASGSRPTDDEDEAPFLSQLLGPLEPNDRYFVDHVFNVEPWGSEADDPFVDNLRTTATMITDARYDSVVVTPAIPEILLATTNNVAEVQLRDGWLQLTLTDGTELHARMPSFDAGHMVPAEAPQELHDELAAWLIATGL